MKALPNSLSEFYYWWFKHYSSWNTCSRYQQQQDSEEYGISSATFLDEYMDDAIKDAKDYFERNPSHLDNMFYMWETSLRDEKNRINHLLEDIKTFKISLTETSE